MIFHIGPDDNHSLALNEDGNLWGTGSSYYGQLGVGDNIVRALWTLIIIQ